MKQFFLVAVVLLVLAGCSSVPRHGGSSEGRGAAAGLKTDGRPAYCPEGSPYPKATEDPATRGNYTAGGLYKPGVRDSTPTYIPQVECIPEPEVRDEPRSVIGNRSPYEVLGKRYKVLDKPDGFVEKGTASYYGIKFHGRLTSNREVYDMYAFSAAHKTLPLPSFARVTNLENGESVIVRVNDRGPFHDGRVIDLSYAAAVRLGITRKGTGQVEVRALTPGKPESRRGRPRTTATVVTPAVPAPAVAVAAPATSVPVVVESLPESAGGLATAGGLQLQVASFGHYDNAQRALATLRQAGIDGARLIDASTAERPLWRLRVTGVEAAQVADLVQRVAALGLGTARLVDE